MDEIVVDTEKNKGEKVLSGPSRFDVGDNLIPDQKLKLEAVLKKHEKRYLVKMILMWAM